MFLHRLFRPDSDRFDRSGPRRGSYLYLAVQRDARKPGLAESFSINHGGASVLLLFDELCSPQFSIPSERTAGLSPGKRDFFLPRCGRADIFLTQSRKRAEPAARRSHLHVIDPFDDRLQLSRFYRSFRRVRVPPSKRFPTLGAHRIESEPTTRTVPAGSGFVPDCIERGSSASSGPRRRRRSHHARSGWLSLGLLHAMGIVLEMWATVDWLSPSAPFHSGRRTCFSMGRKNLCRKGMIPPRPESRSIVDDTAHRPEQLPPAPR